MPQVGQSIPRLEARAKVTGRAEYAYNLSLPGMLHGKIFRSTRGARPHPQRSTRAPRRSVPGVHRVDHRRGHPSSSSPIPITARRSTISRSWRWKRSAMSASRWRWCWPPIRMWPSRRCSLIAADYDELPAVYDEVEAMDGKIIVHDVLKPAGTFPDLKHLAGRRGTNVALDYHLRYGDVDKALRRGRPRVRAHVPHASRCCTCRSSRSSRWPSPATVASPSTPPRRCRRSCASRSRACSAGRRTACG